ncbi:histone-lysine N-methyltransferase 2A [Erpetoichthys calabaricus]|uniref:[histone H3]-lysine(4) N-methyltransferase n=1 Tax=Erpetoichthys calabaricus TaxID=27687 RepID=A0A8C4XEG0_ERPCA|nr:histone-lysine N-methyltransferase 2A [Erpetoichthys calabaricus]
MMAAVGCGSAASASVVGVGLAGMAVARGRFPGRPWGPRSRLRSEKRLQLGRSWSETGEASAAGSRPCHLGLAAFEDPSLVRLLGLAANRCRSRQAGYSSSGSEEGDDFPGFTLDDVAIGSPLRSAHRFRRSKMITVLPKGDSSSKHPFRKSVSEPEIQKTTVQSTKANNRQNISRIVKKTSISVAAPPPKRTVSSSMKKTRASLKEGASSLAQMRRKRGPARNLTRPRGKEVSKATSSTKNPNKSRRTGRPWGAVKLIPKGTNKKSTLNDKKPVKRLKVVGFKYVSKAKKLRGTQLSSAHVKLKVGRKPKQHTGKDKQPISLSKKSKACDGNASVVGRPRGARRFSQLGNKTEVSVKIKDLKKDRKRIPKASAVAPSFTEEDEKCSSNIQTASNKIYVKGKRKKLTDNKVIKEKIPGLKLRRVKKIATRLTSSSVEVSSESSSNKLLISGTQPAIGEFSTSSEAKASTFVWTLVKKRGRKPKVQQLDIEKQTIPEIPDEEQLADSERCVIENPIISHVKHKKKRGRQKSSLKQKEECKLDMGKDFQPNSEAVIETPVENVVPDNVPLLEGEKEELSIQNVSETLSSEAPLTATFSSKPARNVQVLKRKRGRQRKPKRIFHKKVQEPTSEIEKAVSPSPILQDVLPGPSLVENLSPQETTPKTRHSKKGRPRRHKYLRAPKLANSEEITPVRNNSEADSLEEQELVLSLPAPDIVEEQTEDIKLDMTSENDGGEEGKIEDGMQAETEKLSADTSTPVRKKLVRVLKAKYRRKAGHLAASISFLPVRSKGRPSLAKKVDRELAQQLLSQAEKGTVVEHPASRDLKRGKSRFLKNIRHFIMPVVSARSSRIIKTPKRFMDDDGMSVLPRKNSPKKALQLPLHSKFPLELTKDDDLAVPNEQSLPERDQEFVAGDNKTVDYCEDEADEAAVSQELTTLISKQPPSPTNSVSDVILPEKRRSLLREPSFKWSILGGTVSDVCSLTKGSKECVQQSKQLVTPHVPPDDTLSSLAVTPALLKNTVNFSKTEDKLKIYESLKKLTAKASKKVIKDVSQHDTFENSSLCFEMDSKDKELGSPEPSSVDDCIDTHSLNTEPEEKIELDTPEKEKLKIEDIDSPGVVRKVAIRLKSLNTELAQENGSSPIYSDDIGEVQDELPNADQIAESDRTEVEEKSSAHKIRLTGANKRMFHLLKRAKVQLIKIDQQKQLKCSQLLSGSGTVKISRKESRDKKKRKLLKMRKEVQDVSEQDENVLQPQPVTSGPRIKHVCRDAAVVLGQPRAVVPDDIPRLSALPLHERMEIAASPIIEDAASASEVESPPVSEQKATKIKKSSASQYYFPIGKRAVRCGKCKGCLHQDDCGKCINCLDKPKFGGKNTKRQCCVFKKCDKIEQRKLIRQGFKSGKVIPPKRRRASSVCYSSDEDTGSIVERQDSVEEAMTPDHPRSPSLRKQPRRCVKLRSYCDLLDSDDSELDLILSGSASTSPGRRRATAPRSTGDFVSLDEIPDESSDDGSRQRKSSAPKNLSCRRRPEKSQLDQTPPSVLAALVNGFSRREKEPPKPAHKIRVDFKEDSNIRNVWLMGGLSILTSIPITTQYVCLLCASKGQHEMIFCQVCCEPFHLFCLESHERPLDDNKENWCCQRCKFCHVCGRKNKHSKPLLECERCQNSYHPACLGPNYPKPSKRKKSWVCMTCIRCKSCGVTPGKSWDSEWNQEKNLCPDCCKLYDQGNYCPICFKCYEDNDYDSQMMQCSKCNHWVHAKCEELSDELYEILSNLPESVVYTCTPCSEGQPIKWKEMLTSTLNQGIKNVLLGLLTSRLSVHMLRCKECSLMAECNSVVDYSPVCDLQAVGRKFDRGEYTSLKSFHEDIVQIIRRRMDEEAKLPMDQRQTSVARSFYLKLLERFFSWFNSQDPKIWDPSSRKVPNGILPNAVLPPSAEHVYAQWREREDYGLSRTFSGSHDDLERKSLYGEKVLDTRNSKSKEMSLQARLEDGPDLSYSIDHDAVENRDNQRQCALCLKFGDDKPNDAGRLLYLGQNEWAHVNCAFWSAEVFEEENGSLMNVHMAVARGRLMRCERCYQPGATVGCCLSSCQSNYHFMCARSQNCVFQEDKKVYCQRHRELISGKTVSGMSFEVLRRICIDFDGISLKRKFLTGLEPEAINLKIGSLQVEKLGVLTELSMFQGKLLPVGYECSRWYWSTLDPKKRCKYTCRIMEVRPPTMEKTEVETPDQGDNLTIAHSPHPDIALETPAKTMEPPLPTEQQSDFLVPASKSETAAHVKITSYSQARKPVGGFFRPLPSPESTASKSHHILTVSDLEDPSLRRQKRLSPLSHHSVPRSRIASPTTSLHSGAVTLRTGSLHSKGVGLPLYVGDATDNSSLSPLSRSNSHSTSSKSPLGVVSNQMSTSGLPSNQHYHHCSWQSSSSPPSPEQNFGSLCLSPLGPGSQLPKPRTFDTSGQYEILHQNSSEVPHDFLDTPDLELVTSSETNSLLNQSSLVKEAQIAVDQDFPYAAFDDDSEIAVASVLSAAADLSEFDENLLNDDITLHCGAQIVVGEEVEHQPADIDNSSSSRKNQMILQSRAATEEWGNTSSDEDMDNYYSFVRTVTHGNLREEGEVDPSNTIAQLDGVDDGSESDVSVITTDGSQTMKTVTNSSTSQAPPAMILDSQGVSHTNGLTSGIQFTESFSGGIMSFPTGPMNVTCMSSKGNLNDVGVKDLFSEANIVPVTEAEVCNSSGVTVSSASPQIVSERSLSFSSGEDQQCKNNIDPDMLQLCSTEISVKESQLSGNCSTTVTELSKEVFLDPSSGHFVSVNDGSVVPFENLDSVRASQVDVSSESLNADLFSSPQLSVNTQTGQTPSTTVVSVELPQASNYQVQSSTPYFKPTLCSAVPSVVSSVLSQVNPGVSQVDALKTSFVSSACFPTESVSEKKKLLPSSAVDGPLIQTIASSTHHTTPIIARNVSANMTLIPSACSVSNATGRISLPQTGGLPVVSYSQVSLPVIPSSLPTATPTVTIVPSQVSSSPQIREGVCFQRKEPLLSQPIHPSTSPLLINGFSSGIPLSKEQATPRTCSMSINLATPRPTVEQPQVVTSALSGHTLLTVREIGGPNVDGTPHVLLVNKFGQVFIKNPVDNTFQLPPSNSPSLSLIGQIKSLLQNNTLASTIVAAGNLSTAGVSQPVQCSTICSATDRSISTPLHCLIPGQPPTARYISSSSNGNVSNTEVNAMLKVGTGKPQKPPPKPKKKKKHSTNKAEPLVSTVSQSIYSQNSMSSVFAQASTRLKSPLPGGILKPELPNWAICNLNMDPPVSTSITKGVASSDISSHGLASLDCRPLKAGYQLHNSSYLSSIKSVQMGPRIVQLNPPQIPEFRTPPALTRASNLPSLNTDIAKQLRLESVEKEDLATPVAQSRSQVRIKRVSSISDRIAVKKSRIESEITESSNSVEDVRRSINSSKSGRVRIKTPTVKGVLDLDKIQEQKVHDIGSTGQSWDHSSNRLTDTINEKGSDWQNVCRSAITTWNKYSGTASSSDEEYPDPVQDENTSVKDQPHLVFEIKSDDGFHVEADSIEVAWKAVTDRVQEARANARLKQLSFSGMTGMRMLGMLHDAVVFLVEQLFGANLCSRHKFHFHKQEQHEEELFINPSGCARAEVYVRKSTFDMFNFLASQHRQLPENLPYDEEEDEVPLKSTRRATSLELPMAMRFRHLEKTSKEAVGVYRSAIHGRGLFCKRNIDAGEMVIEYSGIVIRSVLTDKREKYYDSKGIGCYMFRIDDFDVVDATMHGNAARFINHSCEPNCYSRVINVEGQKHIVIFALRKIYRGEELTYDYKFPIEDANNKLHCNCGAKRCRRFLN